MEPVEARPPSIIQGDHLAIQNEPVIRQRLHRPGDLGEGDGRVVAPSGEQLPVTPFPRRQQAVAVVLELEDPPFAGEGALAGLRQHEVDVGNKYRSLGRTQPFQPNTKLGGGVAPCLQLFHRQSRQDRALREPVTVGRGEPVTLLDQEPFLLTLLALHQGPGAAQLVNVVAGNRLFRAGLPFQLHGLAGPAAEDVGRR